MRKKVWSVLWGLCLLLCLLPTTAMAEEGTRAVAKVGSTEYTTIDEAIANWTNGTTLTLLDNVTLSDIIKLNSNEYHILDLGVYTMTAAPNKDAIQYVIKGRTSPGYALDIKADAINPGGITATGGSVVRHTKPLSGAPNKDRPITRFYGGIFNASYIVRQGGSWESGYTGASAPHFYFYGGVYNGTIYTNRSQNQFFGGIFNGNMQMSVDSSAYTLVAGGAFKNLSNSMRSELNDDKFMIASHKCTNTCGCGVAQIYDKEVYIDDNGYMVIAAARPGQSIKAAVATTPNASSDFLAYSKVASEGVLNYTDVYTALEENKTATVTVYADELDLTGIDFTGTLVLPDADSTLTVTFSEDTVPTYNVKASSDDLIAVYEASDQTGTGTYVLIDASIANLITSAKNEAISAAEALVNSAKTELQVKIDTKADSAAVSAAIAELQGAIDTLEDAKDNYADADAALKAELEAKIAAAKTDAVSAAETLVNNAKTELQVKIDAKADSTAVSAAIDALQSAIDTLETAKDNYVDADTALKAELEAKIAAAKTDAVSAAETLVNNAKTELQVKIDAKADSTAVSAAIDALQSAIDTLETAKDNYADADAALKAELEVKIAAAKTDAVSAAEALVNSAKTELQTKIDAKADGAAVSAAIAELQGAIDTLEDAKDNYVDADAALKAQLEAKIAAAKTDTVSAAEALVNSAKTELQAKIDTKADSAAVNAAIANLQNAIAALEKVKDHYITADAALKAELESAIAKAKQDAIDAAKGYIPYIGENGNWWIAESDTGVSASGIPGAPGKDGITPQLRINSENIWEVSYDVGKTWESMGISAVGSNGTNGQNGVPGQDGSDGAGISNIEKTSVSGNVDTYTITLTNGKTFTFTVTNGVDGKDGTDGADGKNGADAATVIPTVIGSTALLSNIALFLWILTKKKSLV